MTTKDILLMSAGIICDEEIDLGIASKKRAKLIDCANMIYGELTEEYLPLRNDEKLTADGGRIYYTAFSKSVKDVIAVYKDGVKIPFELFPLYLKCAAEGEVDVKYVYHAEELTLDGDVLLPISVTPSVMATGIASEYFYRSGLIDEAVFYKTRYDNSIANLSRKRGIITLKARKSI